MADTGPPPAKIPRVRSPSPSIANEISGSSHEGIATVSDASPFTKEIWANILSHCSVFDLFCLRDARGFLRRMISREMLEEALQDAGLARAVPDNEEDWECLPVQLRNPICLMKMLCLGPCSVCGTWSALPPASSDMKIRLCGSEACFSYMFSEYMSCGWTVPPAPETLTCCIRQIRAFDLPLTAEEWQPHMLMDYRRYVDRPSFDILTDIAGGSNCRTLLKTLLRAKQELSGVGWKWDYSSDIVRDSEDKEGAVRLADIFADRRKYHEVTKWLYCLVSVWRVANERKDMYLRIENQLTIEDRAEYLNQPYDPSHPLVQRVLEAHARDVSTIYANAADCLFPLPDLPKSPWDAEFAHPNQDFVHYPLPRTFVPFMDRVTGEAGCTDAKSAAATHGKDEPEPSPEHKSVPQCRLEPEEPAVAAKSDGNALRNGVAHPNRAPGGHPAISDVANPVASTSKSRRNHGKPPQRPAMYFSCRRCGGKKIFVEQKDLNAHLKEMHGVFVRGARPSRR
ncbi:uncharacterized protein SCHCODRAFT_02505677 [Schizophyllum commune H4-8]|nr:uncharacterized protein SCHCODRAFT_02505677 [Schizophyllum commune H4-8]KAI5890949.1 hypothetical protein SCHCODRAFT_02505677 [Schizophyllum commune H4-8]